MSKSLKGALTEKRGKLAKELLKGPLDRKTVSFIWYGEVRTTSLNAIQQQLGKLQGFGYIEKIDGMWQLTAAGRSWAEGEVVTLESLRKQQEAI